VFLLADAVACAKAGQEIPQGYYNLELMVESITRKGEVLLCGTCVEARGLTDAELVRGAQRSTMDVLARERLQLSACQSSEPRSRTLCAASPPPWPDRSKATGRLQQLTLDNQSGRGD
jgi:hypothetical protein